MKYFFAFVMLFLGVGCFMMLFDPDTSKSFGIHVNLVISGCVCFLFAVLLVNIDTIDTTQDKE